VRAVRRADFAGQARATVKNQTGSPPSRGRQRWILLGGARLADAYRGAQAGEAAREVGERALGRNGGAVELVQVDAGVVPAADRGDAGEEMGAHHAHRVGAEAADERGHLPPLERLPGGREQPHPRAGVARRHVGRGRELPAQLPLAAKAEMLRELRSREAQGRCAGAAHPVSGDGDREGAEMPSARPNVTSVHR